MLETINVRIEKIAAKVDYTVTSSFRNAFERSSARPHDVTAAAREGEHAQ